MTDDRDFYMVLDCAPDEGDMRFYAELISAVSDAIADGRIVLPLQGVQEARIRAVRDRAALRTRRREADGRTT